MVCKIPPQGPPPKSLKPTPCPPDPRQPALALGLTSQLHIHPGLADHAAGHWFWRRFFVAVLLSPGPLWALLVSFSSKGAFPEGFGVQVFSRISKPAGRSASSKSAPARNSATADLARHEKEASHGKRLTHAHITPSFWSSGGIHTILETVNRRTDRKIGRQTTQAGRQIDTRTARQADTGHADDTGIRA